MLLEVLPKDGGPPFKVEAAQLLVLNEQGTPVIVAGEHGAAIIVAHAKDPDFNHVLRLFGRGHVHVQLDKFSVPAGAGSLHFPSRIG